MFSVIHMYFSLSKACVCLAPSPNLESPVCASNLTGIPWKLALETEFRTAEVCFMRAPQYVVNISYCFLSLSPFICRIVHTEATPLSANLFTVSPSPSCPFWLSPHTQTSVSVITSLGGKSVSPSPSAHRQQVTETNAGQKQSYMQICKVPAEPQKQTQSNSAIRV